MVRTWSLIQRSRILSSNLLLFKMKETREHAQCSKLQKMSKQETIRLREQHIGASVTLFFKKAPLKIVKGEGQYMYDEQGNAYLDCINNVAHVGHCHPHVVEAGSRQMSLLSTNSRYLHDDLVLYARRLTQLFPSKLSVCYFVNSGSEANDLALRLARAHTGHKDVIALEGAYHGHLTSIVDISPYKFLKMPNHRQKKWVHLAPIPCEYRGKYPAEKYPNSGELYADEVGKIIQKANTSGRKIAAFIAESMISCGGQVPLPENYLRKTYEYVRAAGGVCIADEVQVGFGRMGDHFWAFELAGKNVCPDIVTIGKPIGNGHPIACVVTTPEIAKSFQGIGTEYFNTYGGNPVSMAIANAVMDVIENEQLCKNACKIGNFMLDELKVLCKRHSFIGDVRGRGMFLGVDVVRSKQCKTPAPELAEYIVAAFKQNYILMSTEGVEGNVLKFKPPMCFNMENAVHWLDVLKTILNQLDDSKLRQELLQMSMLKQQSTTNNDESKLKESNKSLDSGRGGSSCSSSSSSDASSCMSDDSLTSLSSGEENN